MLYLRFKITIMANNILFISGGEIVLVILLALLFFGAKAIPDIAKTLGKGMREFKKATNEIQREINEYSSDLRKEVNEVKSTVNQKTNEIKKEMDNVTSSVNKETEDISKEINNDKFQD